MFVVIELALMYHMKIYRCSKKCFFTHDFCLFCFNKGRRLRVSVSTTYWPWIWPSPVAATITLLSPCHVLLPLIVSPPPPLECFPFPKADLAKVFSFFSLAHWSP